MGVSREREPFDIEALPNMATLGSYPTMNPTLKGLLNRTKSHDVSCATLSRSDGEGRLLTQDEAPFPWAALSNPFEVKELRS